MMLEFRARALRLSKMRLFVCVFFGVVVAACKTTPIPPISVDDAGAGADAGGGDDGGAEAAAPDGGRTLNDSITPGCTISWTFPGGYAATNDPCKVDGGFASDPLEIGSAFVTVSDAYFYNALGVEVVVQITQEADRPLLGTTTYSGPEMDGAHLVSVSMGQTSSVVCKIEQDSLHSEVPTATSAASLTLDVTSNTQDNVHGDITATVDCEDYQAHTYLGAVGTVHIVY